MYSIYFEDDQRKLGREDAVWYADGYDLPLVKVEGEKSNIFVIPLGETRIAYYVNKQEAHALRKPKDLISCNINNDKDLFDLQEAGTIEWINNPWFELHIEYENDTVYSIPSLEYVCHTLTEAIDMAIEFSSRTHKELMIGA
jgi:hypothetical protein